MADVNIDTSAHNLMNQRTRKGWGPYSTAQDTQYEIYISDAEDLVYRKSTDGGGTWGSETNIDVGTIAQFDCYPEWHTNGDAGTIIGIAFTEGGSLDTEWRGLDTSDDSISSATIIHNGTSANASPTQHTMSLSLVKAEGGNWYCVGRQNNDGTEKFFARSTDGGSTWSSRAAAWDGDADRGILLPGAEADNNDIYFYYWDEVGNNLKAKVYDDSGNSWGSATTIHSDTDFGNHPEIFGITGAQRHSDQHLIVCWQNRIDVSNADTEAIDSTNPSTNTTLTDPIVNQNEHAYPQLVINQQNDDLYVFYLNGGLLGASVGVDYVKSTDGGTTWDAAVTFADSADDDLRAVGVDHSIGDNGGRIMASWFNDDLNDVITNKDNSIAVAAAGGLSIPVAMRSYRNMRTPV